jgi:hypothetical protein
VRKWLKQQSRDFYAAGFNTLVKQWDKCINVGGGHIEKYMFFPGLNITFYGLYLSVAYLQTLHHINKEEADIVYSLKMWIIKV